MTHRKRSGRSLAVKAAELSLAVPQVVAHRTARMAMAGAQPTARDRREFQRMVAEKNAAFVESWSAMTLQTMRAQQTWALSFFRTLLSMSVGGKPSAAASAARLQGAALDILDKGLAPVHRKAVANAKRLARTRRR